MHEHLRMVVAALAVGALALAACGGDDDDNGATPTGATSPASSPATTPDAVESPAESPAEGGEGETVSLTATLDGQQAVPAGDDDGTGIATVTIDTTTGEVCFVIEVENIGEASATHIHEGAAGTSGGVVIGLEPPAGGSVDSCVTADDASIAADVAANPSGYYVNVHNEEFPEGAVRGQLEAA